MSNVELEHTSVEKLTVTIRSDTDPTGSAVEFEMTAASATSPTGSWTAGTWDTTWNATTLRVGSLTPAIGGAGFALTEGERYRLWVRFSSTVIKLAAGIFAT